MATIDLATEDDLKYTFYPVSSGAISFRVRAANDAHIALTTGPEESDPMIEIFIGGWSNSKSIIRRNRTKPDKVEAETPAILNGGEFRGFWVRWNGGSITVGKDGESTPFMSWDDPEPFPIGHFGVCTGWGATGTWMVEGHSEFDTNENLQYVFRPVISGELEFEFKGPSNCHIALTKDSAETEPMYEIILGGWDNKKSVIRHKRQKPDKVTADTENILHDGQFRKFLIQWCAGRIIVRSAVGSGPVIMEWTDEDPFPVTHFGVRTAWGATGKWRISNKSGACARVAPTMAAPSAPSAAFDASCWVDVQGGDIPASAVAGGQDGEEMFIARASHEGALIPGKAMRSHGVCYVPWGGQEHGKSEYQVLCGCSVGWLPCTGGDMPGNALPGGETEDGETLFIGRVSHEGSLTIGKVQPSHGVCYIPYGGEELGFNDYELLIQQ